MIPILITILFLIIGIIIFKYTDEELTELIGFMLIIFSAVVLFIMFGFLIINHLFVNIELTKYNTAKETIENQRLQSNSIENAALTNKILEINAEIADTRYWNSTVWDIFIPDRLVEERELIK